MLHSIITLCLVLKVQGILLPEYEVKLHEEEEFVISELLERADVEDIYEEEELIKQPNIKTNPEKYFRIHELSKHKNKNKEQKTVRNWQNFPESNPDLEESHPWIGGHFGQINDEGLMYFDDEAKSNKTLSEKLEKRQAENTDYNYENLKAQYDKSLKKAESENDTLKYKEVKEEETPDEVVKKLVDFNARNCSEEEKSEIGIKALKCLLAESKKKHFTKNQKFFMLKKLLLVTVIWLFVYLVIALPLWCQYGWCCCCCRCKFCNPREEIDEIKGFCFNNPPGVYQDKDGNLKKYKPTTYEMYAQKNLEKAVQRL